MYFIPPRWLNWVPGIRSACRVHESTLRTCNPHLMGLYAPEWRLRNSIILISKSLYPIYLYSYSIKSHMINFALLIGCLIFTNQNSWVSWVTHFWMVNSYIWRITQACMGNIIMGRVLWAKYSHDKALYKYPHYSKVPLLVVGVNE